MPSPKFRRREVRIDPRLPIPPYVIDVVADDSKSGTAGAGQSIPGNGYSDGPIRDDSGNSPTPRPDDESPVLEGTNPWGVATIVDQVPVINSDGVLVIEVTFKLPDWSTGYETRVNRA